MNPTALVFGLGSSSLFASRAFVPAFLTSLFLRFGDRLPFLSDLPLFGDLGGEPTWFTHGAVIAALGILAALEVAATKSPEADEALAIVDQYLKVGMAILCTLGVLTSADKGFIEETIAPAQQGASLLGTLVLPFVGVVVFFLAGLRADLKEVLFEMDEDDDLGLRKLLSWAEDSWVLAGTLVLILYPLVMIVILGVVFGVMHMIRKYLERREDRSKTPCEGCGEAVYACALECHACHKETAEPHVIGFFGQSRDTVVTDREQHALDLAEKRRCPACATRLRERNPRQICTQCGHQVFGETTFEKQYTGRVAKRLPLTLGICALLGLIPVVGLIPAVIYYRLRLVAPFRRYMPLGSRFCLKGLLRIAMLVLGLLQVVPVLGAATMPLMATLSYLLYRRGFSSPATIAEHDLESTVRHSEPSS